MTGPATDRESPLQVLLGCTDCQATYVPTDEALTSGDTGCPGCGGWTFLAELAAPEVRQEPDGGSRS